MVKDKRSGIPIGFHRAQQSFIAALEFINGFVGGRGAGKTLVGGYKTMRKAKRGGMQLVVSPTMGLMRKTTWRTDIKLFKFFNRLVDINKSESTLTISTDDGGTSEVWYRTGEDPDNLRGPNLSRARLDEASVMSEKVMKIILPSLREGGVKGEIDLCFTPKGKSHWTYKVFFDEEGNRKPNTSLVQCRSVDNPWMPEDLVEQTAGTYSNILRQQELEGLFIDAEGIMFLRDWFEIVPCHPHTTNLVRYWDKAATHGGGDWSVGLLMAECNGVFYIVDVVRGQWSPKARNLIMKLTAEKDHRNYHGAVRTWVEQEPGSGGKESALLTMQLLAGHSVFIDKVSGLRRRKEDKIELPGEGKIVRAQPLAAQSEEGLVKVVRGKWNLAFLDELCSFPENTHDDQVDAASGAFNKLAPFVPMGDVIPELIHAEWDAPEGVRFDRTNRRLFGR